MKFIVYQSSKKTTVKKETEYRVQSNAIKSINKFIVYLIFV